MSEPRLTPADWIDHGLRTLAAEGAGALKVGPMAQALNVSRGSFYWHFADLADFRAQLLAAWRARTTDQVVARMADQPGPERLRQLLRAAFSVRNAADRAVRAWATEDATVAAAVAEVDARRVAYIAEYLVDAGVDPAQAAGRATFLYWAYLGQALVMAPDHAKIPAEALDAIAGLLAV